MEKTKVTKDIENKTLIIERVFDAPKEKLWRAYADKEWFEKWWGPEGWETMAKEFDFQPGGRIHYRMKCVDPNQGEWYGREEWGLMKIESIDEPNSITMTDFFVDEQGNINDDMPEQTLIVELKDEDGKTRMIDRSILDTAEQLEQLVQMGMAEGFSSQLNKLEELVAE